MFKKADLLQQTFLKGKAPKDINGFYKGKLVHLIPGSLVEFFGGIIANFWLPWYGKTFYNRQHKGDNILPSYLKPFIRLRFGDKSILRKEGNIIHVFPFNTSVAKGIKDQIEVLQLNYNLPENPPSVRKVVDELVYLGKNEYLGKAYIKEGQNARLVTFFSLKK